VAYVNIPNSVFEAGKPARALDMRNLRDNLSAVAAGDVGAPRVLGKALGGIRLGEFNQTNGDIYSGFTGLDGHGLILFFGGSNGTARARFTADNGVTWGSDQSFGSAIFSVLSVNIQTGVWVLSGITGTPSRLYGTGIFTVPAGCNGIQIRGTGSAVAYSYLVLSLGGIE
jgi:hypothetical protein